MSNGPGRRPRRDSSRPSRSSKARAARTSSRSDKAGPAAGHPKERRTIRTLISGRGLADIAPKGSLLRPLAALAVVVTVVALVLAAPLRQYLSQRAELAAAQAQEQQLRDELAQVQQHKDALSDPNYVKAQARKHLQYVSPGETVYRIVAPPLPEVTSTVEPTPEPRQWYSQLWATLLDPPGAGSPVPTTSGGQVPDGGNAPASGAVATSLPPTQTPAAGEATP